MEPVSGWVKEAQTFGPPNSKFDASQWQAVNLRTTGWSVRHFETKPDWDLTAHGSKPVSRSYPANAVGWYRRTFPHRGFRPGQTH